MTSYWRHPDTYIGSSKIAGRGLFASNILPIGTLLVVASGDLMNSSQYKLFRKLNPDATDGLSLESDQLWLVTKKTRDVGNSFLNHSCDPNAVIEGQIYWRAYRAIHAGEEICTDYSTFVNLDQKSSFNPCQCQAPNCRINITYKDWQSPKLQNQYKEHFSSHILREIVKLKK